MSEPSIERREGHFKGYQGLELFFQSWTARDARATLVISHGISEHSECYASAAAALVALGWNVFAWDLRGHGRSEGKRGFVEDFEFYAEDLKIFLRFLAQTGKLGPRFALIGHSMGGLITLRYVIDAEGKNEVPKPATMCLSSPLLGIALPVPMIKDFAARLLNRLAPQITLFNEVHYDYLTRDPVFRKGYENDPLRHDKISPPLYLGMLSNIAYVNGHVDRVTLPTLIQAAGQEKVVSLPATRRFFDKIPAAKKKLIVYDESMHEIYNDLDRKTVFKDLDAFLRDTLTPPSTQGKR